jgi:hypothetical protein
MNLYPERLINQTLTGLESQLYLPVHLKKKPLPRKDILKDIQKIKSSALQEYLEIIIHRIAIDIQVQYILKDLDKRTQQIKDAAIPDTQKLSLIQRYRTADERLLSKSLGELLELQKRRKTI